MKRYEREVFFDHLNSLYRVADKAFMDNRDAIRCFHSIRKYSEELYVHSIGVALLSVLLGRKIYGEDTKLEDLFLAALLHDYGKRFISECILCKAGELTTDERKTVELHSIVGSFYLKRETELSEDIIDAVLDHHEKIDASGYLNKKNDNINEYAKIITIADVYNAMVTDRIYRKRIAKDNVIEFLSINAGKNLIIL